MTDDGFDIVCRVEECWYFENRPEQSVFYMVWPQPEGHFEPKFNGVLSDMMVYIQLTNKSRTGRHYSILLCELHATYLYGLAGRMILSDIACMDATERFAISQGGRQ